MGRVYLSMTDADPEGGRLALAEECERLKACANRRLDYLQPPSRVLRGDEPTEQAAAAALILRGQSLRPRSIAGLATARRSGIALPDTTAAFAARLRAAASTPGSCRRAPSSSSRLRPAAG